MTEHRNIEIDPNSRELLGEAAFAITARIALQLGRESISNSIVALIELVKNAYDADSENIHLYFKGLNSGNPEIIIEDDGNGMNIKQLEYSWLIIGTDTKLKVSKSKSKKRVLTGEKGLGRLGLDRLSECSILQTFTEDDSQGIELVIDWKKYESTNERLESIKHQMFRIPKLLIEPISGLSITKNKGTRLTLKGIKDVWAKDDISKLRRELALLVSPFSGVNDFSIYLHVENEDSTEAKIISEDLLNAAEWKITSDLTYENGIASISFSMTSFLKEAVFNLGPWSWGKKFPELNGRAPECGPVSFVFYYIPREDVPTLSLKRAQIGKFLDSNQGIRIYRDGFRVMPYGKPSGDGDWLNLGLRRTRSPGPSSGPIGGWKVGYNQMVGAVFIEREKNSTLLDQTNREGIVEGTGFYDLRRFALFALETFEEQHQKYIRALRKHENDEVEQARLAVTESVQASKDAFEQIKDTVQTVERLLEQTPSSETSVVATQEFGKIYQMVETMGKIVIEQQGKQEELVRSVDKREEARNQEFQRQKDTLGNLASLGILSTTFGHETEAASNIVLGNSDELKQLINSLYWLSGELQQKIDETLDDIMYGAKKIHTFASFTLRNVGRDNRQRTKIFMDKIITKVFESFSTSLADERNIKIDFDFPDHISPITAFSIDWESIIVNFITNSTWALEDKPKDERIIKVQLCEIEEKIRLSFSDSGFGIAEGMEENIFLPTITTKRNRNGDLIGTGMGLAIVQGFVESYGGTISVESPSEIGGAKFIIEVPIRHSER